MVYVDSDFFLALLKPTDWLAQRARALYDENREELTSSVATVIEVLLIGHRFSLNPELVVGSIFALVPNIKVIDNDTALAAAHLIKEKGLNVFDAFHAAYCNEDIMLSSDHIFDKIGLRRIELEK